MKQNKTLVNRLALTIILILTILMLGACADTSSGVKVPAVPQNQNQNSSQNQVQNQSSSDSTIQSKIQKNTLDNVIVNATSTVDFTIKNNFKESINYCKFNVDNGIIIAGVNTQMQENKTTRKSYKSISIKSDLYPMQVGRIVAIDADCTGKAGTHYYSDVIRITLGAEQNQYNLTLHKLYPQNPKHKDNAKCAEYNKNTKKIDKGIWMYNGCTYGFEPNMFYFMVYNNARETLANSCTIELKELAHGDKLLTYKMNDVIRRGQVKVFSIRIGNGGIEAGNASVSVQSCSNTKGGTHTSKPVQTVVKNDGLVGLFIEQ